LLDDIGCLVAKCSPELPRFLYGHSLGGNLVLNFVLRRQPKLAGVVSSSPLLEPGTAPSFWKLAMATALGRLWPSFLFDSGLTAADLSHDRQAVEAYQSDALVHPYVSARLAVQMLAAGRWALTHASRLALPLLLMHGDQDRITSLAATRQFADRASRMCDLFVSNGQYHELHWEANRAETINRVIEWLNNRR
jgi:alpha-beta hydrolase superfamily lysophospholipase